jgi:hypothetical protein
MLGYTIIGVVVVLAAAAAVIIIAKLQANSLRKRFRLQVANRGNVQSRYEMGGKDPDGALAFQFTLDGDPLPQRQFAADADAPTGDPAPQAEPAQRQEAGGVQTKIGQAVGVSGTIANALNSLGMMLPSSIRSPVVRLASQIQSGQMRAARAGRATDRASYFKRLASSRTEPKAKGPVEPRSGTVETPFVRPAETVDLDLEVRALKPGEARLYPFSISSRAIEVEDAPWVVEEGTVQISAASGLSRYLPYVIVLVITAVLLILVVSMASGNGLS